MITTEAERRGQRYMTELHLEKLTHFFKILSAHISCTRAAITDFSGDREACFRPFQVQKTMPGEFPCAMVVRENSEHDDCVLPEWWPVGPDMEPSVRWLDTANGRTETKWCHPPSRWGIRPDFDGELDTVRLAHATFWPHP